MSDGLFPSSEARGLELRNNLRRLLAHRLQHGIELGSRTGWARAAAYVSKLLDAELMDAGSVFRRAGEIGLVIGVDVRKPDLLTAAWEVSAAVRVGVSAAQIGSDVGLKRAERTAIGDRRMRCIDAEDEHADDRQRRLKAELAAKCRHERGAKPRSQSGEVEKPWEAMGVSRRTYFRRMALNRGVVLSSSKDKGRRHETVPNAGQFHETVPQHAPEKKARPA